MSKLIILRGLSGSGKSTWANAQTGAVVVSRDALRVAFFGSDGPDYYQHAELRSREDFITKVEHAAVLSSLKAGMTVISDNTNIQVKYMKPMANLAASVGAEVEVKVFDVGLHTALARNDVRARAGGRNVPESTIRKQHDAFEQSKKHTLVADVQPKPYTGTPGMPKAFLVDIDGTLAHMRDYRGPFDWKKVGLDDVDEVVADIVRDLKFAFDISYDNSLNALDYTYIIVMSGRDAVCRRETEQWLVENDIPFDFLFMRPEGDMRKDNIVKAELFDEYVRYNYDVKFVLDDRNQVVDMWRAMGLKCLQVEPGEF